MSLSDNLTHLVASVAILSAGVCLIIFGHTFLDPAYVFGTCFTIIGTLLGYKIGAGSTLPAPTPQVIVQAPAPAPPSAVQPAPAVMPPVTNVMLPAVQGDVPPAAG